MKKSVFLGKGLTILFIFTIMLGVMLSAGRMEVSAEESGTSEATITPSEPKGEGTEASPYQIGTAEELYWFAALVNNGDNGACAVLTADITVNTGVLGENGELAKNGDELISWTPISKEYYSYSGIFDGQNHTISGLYFNNPKEEQEAGLFRRLKASGKIINVGIVDSYFNGDDSVGGVCGWNNGTIKNCYYSGTVNGFYCVGGICGENEKSIENCYHIGTVSGTSYVGGICGENKADVKNCYYDNSTGVEKAIGEDTGTAKDVSGKSTKDMHSSDFCKLITYHSCRNITCSLCGGYQEATCNTDGTYEIGNASQLYWFADKVNNENGTYGNANAVLTKDIVVNQHVLTSDGTLNGDGISFKSWTPIGTVSYSTISQGLLENVHLYNGTFDGRNHTISGLYFNNTSTSYIGLFGYVGTSGKISNVGIIDSYFNGKYYVGSICGYNSGGTMEDCYNTANVSGSNYIGGICGYKSGGTIKTCYHTANVSSLQDNSSNVGGICGYNAKGEIISCYYDSTTYSGEKVGTNKGTLACVDGKTAEQFKSGEVTYLLQGNPGEETEVVWGQTLTGDDQQDFPVLGGKPVYHVSKYAVCKYAANQQEPTKTLYSNSNQNIYEPHKDDGSISGSVAYDNKCDYCGEPCHSFNENGICEEEGCGYYQGIITNATYSTTVAYCGDATDAQPKTDDFTVASGTKPEFTWYKGDVTTGDLPTVENALGKDAPKELGIYTLVVNAAGAQKDGTVYTAAELRVKVTITKAQLEGSVTINGTLRCNETVTVNTTGITNKNPGAFSYKWYRVDEDRLSLINGETGASYTLTQEDIGKKIKVVVTSEYCNGTLEATTEATIKKIAAPMEGEGTAEEPYQLGTKEDLYWFANYVNSGNGEACAILTSDITVNTGVLDEDGNLASDTSAFEEWPLIGRSDSKIANSLFSGTFDGQGHTISGLYFDDNSVNYVGLFGFVTYNGRVANVGIKDSYLKGGDVAVGGVCGYNQDGIIENCYNIGSSVNGSRFVGGICGYNISGTIDNCYNTGNVSGSSDNIGGICGCNASTEMDGYGNGKIKNCYNIGVVTGTEAVGSVCGYNAHNPMSQTESESTSKTPKIENCYYNIKDMGIGHNRGEIVKVVGKTTEQFENGEVAYLLQEGQTEHVWGQTLAGENKQLSPVLGGEKVYKVDRYLGCIDAPGEKTVGYSNTEGNTIYEPHRYENGICSFCQKAYQEAVLTTDKYDIDGDDTPEDVYEISNAGQLYWFAGLVNGTLKDEEQNTSANAVLTENITVNTGVLDKDGNLVKDTSKFINWTPIGSNANPFAGTFDGKKYTISGLYFDDSNESYCGLFGFVGTGGKVVGTGVLDSYLKGDVHVGGICGRNESIIENCYYSGVVVGSVYVGGICGISGNDENCTIKNCYNTGTAVGSDNSSDNFVGGVCGYNENGIIENCYNIGSVSGSYAGGVCGNSGNSENSGNTVKNCYNTGVVSGSSEAGGVCGSNIKGTIENCYNTGTISCLEFVGGICGTEASSTIVNCYYNNSVYKGNAIGFSNGTVKNVEGKTTEQFQSGEVAYLLQASQKDQTELVWGQKLTGENPQVSPVLGGDRVYKVKRYPGCEAVPGNPTDEYSNSEEEIFEPHKDDGSQGGTAYDNRCDFCGKELHSFNEDGSCKDAGCVYHKGSITNVSCPTKIVYSGDVANAEPKAGDFTVASGKEPVFTWYQGDVTNGNLPTDSLGATTPKEAGIYTLVVKADGAEKGGIVYTVAELRVKVTIEKEQVKEQPTTPQPSDTTTAQQPSDTTVAQPPKNGDIITDDKGIIKAEVTNAAKKEVKYIDTVTKKAKTITIPATIKINGEIYKVTKIDKNALKGNKKVTKIVVGSNIQSIGDYAFSGCKKLKTIIIQSKKLTTKTVSKKAFKGIAKKVVVKVPKKKRTAYKKLLKKKGLSSKNRIKNY